jgi:hypothetical protein
MSPAVVLGQDLADLAWPVYDSAVAILTVISRGEDHDSDVLVWVELEADPSMRTRVKSSQGRACKSAAGSRSTREGRCPDTMAFSADPPRRVPDSRVLPRQRVANK